MIGPRRTPRRPNLQLHLDLAESPAPAAALWELLGEEQRRAAMALLATMMAQSLAGERERGGAR